jgi:hypothetical protein
MEHSVGGNWTPESQAKLTADAMRKEGYVPAEYAKKPIVRILARMFRDTKGSDFVEKKHPLLYKAYVAFLDGDPVDAAVREERGGSASSGFIRRMLGEVKAKNKIEGNDEPYAPISSLRKYSTMKSPVVFKYSKMPKSNTSKWIQDHFANAKAPAASKKKAPTSAKSPEQSLKEFLEGKDTKERKAINQRIKYYETADYGKKPNMEKLSREEAIKKVLKL